MNLDNKSPSFSASTDEDIEGVIRGHVISDMITWRLHTITALTFQNATLRYGRKFSLTSQEWRAVSMLGGFSPLSLKDLAVRAELEKAFASRTVGGLVDRGLVASEKSVLDGREVVLRLTKEGNKVYRRVLADAIARNENFLIGFTDQQRTALFEMVELLTVNARRMVELERQLIDAGGEPTGNLVDSSPAQVRSLDRFHSDEMRYLVARLSQLVNSQQVG